MSGLKNLIDRYAVGPESRAVLSEVYKTSENYKPQTKKTKGGFGEINVTGELFLETALNRAYSVAVNIEAIRKINEDMSLEFVPTEGCNAWIVAESLRDPDMYRTWIYHDTEILGEDLTKRIGIAVAKDMGITAADADKAALIYDALSALERREWRKENPSAGAVLTQDNDFTAERIERVVSALPEGERGTIRDFVTGVLKEAGVYGRKGEIRWD
jgi:hypothetical protein